MAQYCASTPPTLEQTVSTPGATLTTTYHQQYAVPVSYSAVSGTPTGNALRLTFSDIGTPQTYALATSPATLWLDASPVSVGDHYVSATERYSQNQNQTIASASPITFDIYHQFAVTESYSGSVASGGAPSLACARYGAPSSDPLATTASVKWLDSGCAYAVTKPSADFPGGGVRYETDYANGTLTTGATIDPAFYKQDYVTLGAGILSVQGDLFGAADTLTASGWLDSGGTVASTGSSACSFALSVPAYDYQFGSSPIQAWLNATASSVSDFTSASPPYVTFSAAKVSAAVCVPASTGYTVAGVKDDGATAPYSWASPQLTFSGSGSFEVDFTTAGPSSPPPPPPPPAVTTSTTTVVSTSTSNAIPAGPIPGNEFAIVILTLASFATLVLAYAYRQKVEEDVHDLNESLSRATAGVVPNFTVPGHDPRRKKKRKK